MKVVIDTNVLIAAFISPRGRANELLEHCATYHEIVCSDFILDEVWEKMVDKLKRAPSDVAEAIDLLKTRVQIVTPAPLDKPVSRDAEDDSILGTAVAGQAERIVTGDKDLLVLGNYDGIKISSPSEFLEEEEAE